jgi:DtxR family Mn-dependent transcriptional regulator
MSESVEMYLVMTVMLRTQGNPVPLSVLAEHLSVSSASANEMCRKLEDRGLVSYQPYKGVTLTPDGEAIAQRVISRRRLWMAFLVQSLEIAPDEADDLACRLEHVTSEHLVEALAAFLSRSAPTCPPVPPALIEVDREASGARSTPCPLTLLPVGAHGQIVTMTTNPGLQDLLIAQGLQPGVLVEVLTIGAHGALIVQVGEQQLTLARSLAAQIEVEVAAFTNGSPLLRCAEEMCRGFQACLNGHSRHSLPPTCPRLSFDGPEPAGL